MAIEFLAWHLFFGLALPFAAFGFRGGGKVAVVRIGLVASGVLRLAGLLGPAVGDLIWRLPGVVGYGVVFPLHVVGGDYRDPAAKREAPR
ncbi:MAG: hypothetical protein K0R13_622 [Propionibacteriaceae bacterium]|nr:hypothetical protein [Propionibacteriaceae bacterium]